MSIPRSFATFAVALTLAVWLPLAAGPGTPSARAGEPAKTGAEPPAKPADTEADKDKEETEAAPPAKPAEPDCEKKAEGDEEEAGKCVETPEEGGDEKDPPKTDEGKEGDTGDEGDEADGGDEGAKSDEEKAEDDLEALIKRGSGGGPGFDGFEDKVAERPRSFPYIEHHGYFRFRTDLFYNGHLNTVVAGDRDSGTSAIKAPIIENVANNDGSNSFNPRMTEGATTIATANIRFRYMPTFHLSSSMRIRATFDILDNLVLGSTPDFAGDLARPDVPLSAFASSQASPSAGINGFRDAVRVTEAYGEWQPAFILRVGRMASHWGLGILANGNLNNQGGQNIDADYGDYADRILLGLKLFGVYIFGAYDYVYSGAITDDPTDNFGQPKDLGQADDVRQWMIAIFQKPLSDKEKAIRNDDLYSKFKWTFDWGFYGVGRLQEFDLSIDSYADWRERGGDVAYQDLTLIPRRAWAIVPDVWMRLQKRFNFFEELRIELEGALIYGIVDNVSADPATVTKERELFQFGAALEVLYKNDSNGTFQLEVGLDAGIATGDSAEGFGVDDRAVLYEPDGSPNQRVTAFKFDRNYHVDLLLFRELIGTVTNAFYIKPWVLFDFFTDPDQALGVRLDLLYAQALVNEATPGNEDFLGFEADLKLFYRDPGLLDFDIEAGFLLPGGAFNYRPDPSDATKSPRDAEFAFTIQARLTLQF